MKKVEFLKQLRKHLTNNKVEDIEEIIGEYDDHFTYKINDGYSEEEVSVKLGVPKELASYYLEDKKDAKSGAKLVNVVGLVFMDLIVVQFFILFLGFIISLLAFSISSFAIGFSLFTAINPFGLIPYLPYWCGAVMGIVMVSLSVLSLVGTRYTKMYLYQLFKKYARFHKNIMAQAFNKPTLPSLPSNPQLTKKQSRRMRFIFQLALNAFAISFVLGYIVCAVTAKAFEFWHVFEWFV